LTPNELHGAVAQILDSAGYDVSNTVSIAGAEFDIIARRRNAPTPDVYCIEVTVSNIDNTKYGKDLTHFVMAPKLIDPAVKCVLISASGFAPRTKERAEEANIYCWTYDEFRRLFMPTSAYERYVLGPPEEDPIRSAPKESFRPRPFWLEVEDLQGEYQDPTIQVISGKNDTVVSPSALAWFDAWLAKPESERRWVSLVGDYGSGKTALTKVLLRRWMRDYRRGGTILPIRIELRDFARKFDFEGLLIHFWRSHQLSQSLPLDALQLLIDEGRVVFLLDGYDEMAQNLSLVDRRDCLIALAKAISGRSVGLITSRPNYFTMAEELRVVEVLYSRAQRGIHRLDRAILLREATIDEFFTRHYDERTEVHLNDLMPQQVATLLDVRLSGEPEMRKSVATILDGIYNMQGGQSLGAKPVVITYLLEVAEKLNGVELNEYRPLNDWGIYRLVVDKLVLRDQDRTSGVVAPSERRAFLQAMAVELSKSRKPSLGKPEMLRIVRSLFEHALRRHGDAERDVQEDLFFADLRNSGSLTASEEAWSFSHNSLREFLVAEAWVELLQGTLVRAERSIVRYADFVSMPITQGIVRFLSSAEGHYSALISAHVMAQSINAEAVLNVALPVASQFTPEQFSSRLKLLVPSQNIVGIIISALALKDVVLDGWSFRDVVFDSVDLSGTTFRQCSFVNCEFYSVRFVDASVVVSTMEGCLFESCVFSGGNFESSKCRNVVAKLCEVQGRAVEGRPVLAFFAFRGATVVPDDGVNPWCWHRRWSDFEKLCRELQKDRGWVQYRGLTQRGGIDDPQWSRSVVDALIAKDIIEINQGRELVRLAGEHVRELEEFEAGRLPDYLSRLFRR
jgi:hypothetical protein